MLSVCFLQLQDQSEKRLWTWTELDTVKQSTSIKINGSFFLYNFFKMKKKTTFSSLYTASVYLWVKVIVGVKSSSCSAKTVNVIVILAVQGRRPHAECVVSATFILQRGQLNSCGYVYYVVSCLCDSVQKCKCETEMKQHVILLLLNKKYILSVSPN